jgi:hypothetical protein
MEWIYEELNYDLGTSDNKEKKWVKFNKKLDYSIIISDCI